MFYWDISVLIIISLIIAIRLIAISELISSRRKKQFIKLAVIIIIEVFIDTITFNIVKDKRFVYKILKVVEYSLTPLIPYILSEIVSRRSYWKKLKKGFLLYMLLNVLLQIVAVFIPVMSTEINGYKISPSIGVYILILAITFILLLNADNHTFMQNDHKNFTLIAIELLILLGFVLGVFGSQSNSDWLAVTLAYYIFILHFVNGYLKIDRLSSLLNQRAWKAELAKINYTTAIFIIDGNKFKSINDDYGHQTGDVAIRKIAECILNIYGEYGWCYRMGGDEFAVILKPHVLDELIQNANLNVYEALNSLTWALDLELAEKAKKYPFLINGVSQGYDIYYSPAEYNVDNPKSVDEVLKSADEWMYKKKERDRNYTPTII